MKHARQREAAVGRMEAGRPAEAAEAAAVTVVAAAMTEPSAGSGRWW